MKLWRLCSVLVLISMLFAACAVPAPQVIEKVVEKEVTVAPPASTAPTPKNGKYFVLGWTPMNDPLNEYWKAFDDGIKGAITTAGAQMLYCSPQGDPVKQNDCVDQFIAQNVDMILVYALDASAIASAIKKANDKKIPVGSFTGEVPAQTGAEVTFTVNVDDRTAGRMAGEAMVKALTAKHGAPKGTVLEVQGLMTMTAAQNRGGGFHDIVDQYPDIKVTSKPADWDTGKSTTIIQDWFTANPDTDAIYFHSEGSGVPAAKAALQAMKKWVPAGQPGHVIMTGEDGTNIGFNAIKCGFMEHTGDFGLGDVGPLFGSVAMDYLRTGVAPQPGDVVSRPNTMWKEAPVITKDGFAGPIVVVPITAVTQENVGNPDFFANKYQGAPNGMSPCEDQ